jgi:hypothetical protein
LVWIYLYVEERALRVIVVVERYLGVFRGKLVSYRSSDCWDGYCADTGNNQAVTVIELSNGLTVLLTIDSLYHR